MIATPEVSPVRAIRYSNSSDIDGPNSQPKSPPQNAAARSVFEAGYSM
jgi:hypothetical protein